MKIIHILNTNSYSGAENVTITIINRMKSEYDMTYVSPDGKIREYLKQNDIKYETIKELSTKELKRIINKYKPDIVHAHDFRASTIMAFSNLPVKLISHVHKNDPRMKKVNMYSIIYLLSCIKYKKILLVSEIIKEEFIFRKFVNKKMEVIGNPIDKNKILQLSKEKEVNQIYDIAYLGRMSKEKNPIEFINIVKAIVQSKPQIKAIMIGDGPELQECKRLIKEYNLEENIEMVGFLKNPYPFLKNSKILCITSEWEGFGLAAVEALILGVPVISKNVGGLKNIVDQSCGAIVKNEDEYVKNILQLLNDDNLRMEKSKCAIIKSNKLANIDKYIENIKKIYEGI